MTREPFWRKYLDAADRRDRRDREDEHISELTFALEAPTWFARGGPREQR